MKKINKLLLIIMLLMINLVSVKAFDDNTINISENISLPGMIYSKDNNVTIYNDILNTNSKVYVSKTSLSKADYDKIANENKKLKDLSEQITKEINSKKEELKEYETKANDAKKVYDENPTEENYSAYESAVTTYNTKVDEINTFINNKEKDFNTKKHDYELLIPLDENNFSEMNKLSDKSNETTTYYSFDSDNVEYSLVWVKVVTDNTAYYSYQVYSYNIEKDTSKSEQKPEVTSEEQVTVKEDTSTAKTVKNPKTGIEKPYIPIILIIVISSICYIELKNKKHFTN